MGGQRNLKPFKELRPTVSLPRKVADPFGYFLGGGDSMFCYGTSMNIKILLTYLLNQTCQLLVKCWSEIYLQAFNERKLIASAAGVQRAP